jgi:hypothetical protein
MAGMGLGAFCQQNLAATRRLEQQFAALSEVLFPTRELTATGGQR